MIHSDLKKEEERCRETRGLHRKGIHLRKLRGTNWSGEAEKIIRKNSPGRGKSFLTFLGRKKYNWSFAHIFITITVNIYQDCICQNFLK